MKRIFIMCIFLFSSTLISAQEVVQVQANLGWQNSGISISSGESVVFFARGAWATNADGRPLNWWGPEGRGGSGAILSTAAAQSLIGRIGSNGTPFRVGSYYIYANGGSDPLYDSGTLYFRINDSDGSLGDNEGSVFVSVFKSSHISIATVEANKGWQNSGITISSGAELAFIARGAWATNADGRPLNWWGPEGRGGAGAIFSMAAEQSLIGRIGSTGDPFRIGSYYVYANGASDPLNDSGTLYLRINDSDTNLGDNIGTVHVTVIQNLQNMTEVFTNQKLPNSTKLKQNYPNPFNSSTIISYDILKTGSAYLIIYDSNGREVSKTQQHHALPGHYTYNWDGRDGYGQKLASGRYYYKLKTDIGSETKQMLFIK